MYEPLAEMLFVCVYGGGGRGGESDIFCTEALASFRFHHSMAVRGRCYRHMTLDPQMGRAEVGMVTRDMTICQHKVLEITTLLLHILLLLDPLKPHLSTPPPHLAFLLQSFPSPMASLGCSNSCQAVLGNLWLDDLCAE